MLTKVYSAAIEGVDALVVTIETSVNQGVSISIVGLPDTAVKESYQRIVSAITQSGMRYPHRRIVINLSPADLRKEGAAYDLPMALGILAASETISAPDLAECMIVGELSLDGSVLPVKGTLPIAIQAREKGFRKLIVPAANATEAAVVNNVEVYGVQSLAEAIAVVCGLPQAIMPTRVDTREEFRRTQGDFDFDFAEVKGQESVKRALEVAAAGGHNILMIGSPGSGKSMMAKRLPSILPPLSLHEALETTKIHSVAGKLRRGSTLMTRRPFRTPHHTISPVALVGGGANPQPGEISLAHNGILFLDEFPEFPRAVLEVLRQPMEDRVISISRAKYAVEYPASFMLVASMNPCPCGYYGHPRKMCSCSPGARDRYISRISGPLLDRIDLQIEIEPVEFDAMTDRTPAESSEAIRRRVTLARAIQQQRFADEAGVHCNAQMNSRLLHRHAWPDEAGLARLKERMDRMNLSARAFDRILRVARTIADLEAASALIESGAEIHPQAVAAAAESPIAIGHIAEAINYRSLDRGMFGSGY